jgi:hypothetical protein
MIRTTERFPTEYRRRNIRTKGGMTRAIRRKRIIFIILEREKKKDQRIIFVPAAVKRRRI